MLFLKLCFEDFDYFSLFCHLLRTLYATYASFGGVGSHIIQHDAKTTVHQVSKLVKEKRGNNRTNILLLLTQQDTLACYIEQFHSLARRKSYNDLFCGLTDL